MKTVPPPGTGPPVPVPGPGPVPGPEPEPVVTRGVVVVNALFTVTAEFKFQITVPPAALYSKHPWWLRIDQAKCSNLT